MTRKTGKVEKVMDKLAKDVGGYVVSQIDLVMKLTDKEKYLVKYVSSMVETSPYYSDADILVFVHMVLNDLNSWMQIKKRAGFTPETLPETDYFL